MQSVTPELFWRDSILCLGYLWGVNISMKKETSKDKGDISKTGEENRKQKGKKGDARLALEYLFPLSG